MLLPRNKKPFPLFLRNFQLPELSRPDSGPLRKRKWFSNWSYNPRNNQISNHLECLSRLIEEYSILSLSGTPGKWDFH